MAIDFQNISNHSKTRTAKPSSAGNSTNQLSNLKILQSGPDTVRLTDTASILQKAEQLVATLPVVNSNEISTISEVLKDGSYTVNAERVAEKLIKFEQELPN